MINYTIKRIIYLIPVLICSTFIVYAVLLTMAGCPAIIVLGPDASPEAIYQFNEMFGLNDPLLVQYFNYITGVFRGDLGITFRGRSVASEIMERMPLTLYLGAVSLLFALLLAFPIGIIAAIKHNTWIDGLTMFLSALGLAMPNFWMGLLLLLFFALRLDWFPSFGADSWHSVVLPAVTLGTSLLVSVARTTRSSVLETIKQDYIRTARAKGLSNSKVIRKHALRNALIPILTILGFLIGGIFSGAFIVETIFSWPGVGRLMMGAIASRDIPLILGGVVLGTFIFAGINLIVDVAYAFVDPRIRGQYR